MRRSKVGNPRSALETIRSNSSSAPAGERPCMRDGSIATISAAGKRWAGSVLVDQGPARASAIRLRTLPGMRARRSDAALVCRSCAGPPVASRKNGSAVIVARYDARAVRKFAAKTPEMGRRRSGGQRCARDVQYPARRLSLRPVRDLAPQCLALWSFVRTNGRQKAADMVVLKIVRTKCPAPRGRLPARRSLRRARHAGQAALTPASPARQGAVGPEMAPQSVENIDSAPGNGAPKVGRSC